MSLTRIEIFHFQSLRHVDLELGTFTVIVGPSSSGKSALIRAFKALASNVRGSSVITRGQKAMAITGRTETHTITLERSERSGSYKVSTPLGVQTYTKLAGDVPEQVSAALRIDPVGEGGSVNFASQFDKPYLLDESGATVARVLGELTNVTTLFEAVRNANRVRASASSTLKTRKHDLDHITYRLTSFQGLSDRMRLLEEAEKLDVRRQDLQHRLARLEVALKTVRIAERAIEKAAVPDVPDSAPLNAAMNRYLDLQTVLRGEHAKQVKLNGCHYELALASRAVEQCASELRELVEQAGVCPTCGQPVGGWICLQNV